MPNELTSTSNPSAVAAQPGILGVLRSSQAVRLLAASLLGRLPLGSAPLALLIFARETMTLTAAGVLVGAYTAGTAGGAPVLARFADRWRQPPVMWAAATISTGGLGLVATAPNLATAAAGAVLAGAGAPPFEACLRVLWRHILPEPLVRSAYSLDVATQEIIFVVGPLLTTAAIAVSGPVAGLAATAGVQLAGTAWFAAASPVRQWRGERAARHWAGPLRSSRLRILLSGIMFVGFGIGSAIVAVAGYAEQAGSTGWAGWLLAAQAVGALAGGIGFTRLRPANELRWLPWIAVTLAASYLPLLLTPQPPAMLALMALSGVALPPLLTVTFVTVDAVAPAGTAAEAFAWVATAFTVGSAAGSAIDGFTIEISRSMVAGFALPPAAILFAAAVFGFGRRRSPSPASATS